MSLTGARAALNCALIIAAVSTLGDFIWATWIPRHRPVYGFTHGTLLFLCVGAFLGWLAHRPTHGAIAGAVIGLLATGSFYLMAPLAGYAIMFVVWIAIWIALGVLNEKLSLRRDELKSAFRRGALAAVTSGVAFYLISGIWFPFNPSGWDYAAHFGAWTLAYLPGFAALLVGKKGNGEAAANYANNANGQGN